MGRGKRFANRFYGNLMDIAEFWKKISILYFYCFMYKTAPGAPLYGWRTEDTVQTDRHGTCRRFLRSQSGGTGNSSQSVSTSLH